MWVCSYCARYIRKVKGKGQTHEFALIFVFHHLHVKKEICVPKKTTIERQSLNHLFILTQQILHKADETMLKNENRQFGLWSTYTSRCSHTPGFLKKQLALFQILALLWKNATLPLSWHFSFLLEHVQRFSTKCRASQKMETSFANNYLLKSC